MTAGHLIFMKIGTDGLRDFRPERVSFPPPDCLLMQFNRPGMISGFTHTAAAP
jgi:hypothetical protein